MSETKVENPIMSPLTWGKPSQILRQLGIILLILLGWGLLLALVALPPEDELTPRPSGQLLTWEQDVFPIFQKHCLLCHGASGGYSMGTKESALAGGRSGRAIIPGDAQNSLLHRLLKGAVGSTPQMPLGQPPLPTELIEIISDWINQLPATP
jgi:mono/diheme cytochrome c family protein